MKRIIQLRDILDKSSVAASKWAMESKPFDEAIIPYEYQSFGNKECQNLFVKKIAGSKFRAEVAVKAHFDIGVKYGVKNLSNSVAAIL